MKRVYKLKIITLKLINESDKMVSINFGGGK